MSMIEPAEMPRRPRNVKPWGTVEEVVFLNPNPNGREHFLIEEVDKDVFELSVCVYSDGPDLNKLTRKEFVLSTNSRPALLNLYRSLKEVLNQ